MSTGWKLEIVLEGQTADDYTKKRQAEANGGEGEEEEASVQSSVFRVQSMVHGVG